MPAHTQVLLSSVVLTHPDPLQPSRVFPSVLRLLREHRLLDPSLIAPTGVRGMLTKRDVLLHLAAPRDGPSLRRAILAHLSPTTFDRVIRDYI